MRTRNQIAMLSVLLLLACADNNSWMDDSSMDEPLQVMAQVEQQYVTRANDGGFASADEIGVFVVNRENGEPQPLQAVGNHADNVRFVYDADKGLWTSSRQLYWKDKQTHVDAYGYYPYDSEMTDVEDYPFSIQHNQRDNLKTGRKLSGYEASDFLWAKAENVEPGMPINLKHRHLMAGIQVTLVEGDDFDEGEWETLEKTVLVENTALDTYINMGSGEVGISRSSATASIIPQLRGEQWRAVVAPQTVEAGQSLLAITVGSESYHFKRNEAMKYYPSKLHKFTIRVDKRLPVGDYQFSLMSEAITPWENDLESHNGAAKEYVVVTIQKDQYLEDVIKEMGLNPEQIVNLKLAGTMYSKDNWENENEKSNLSYIRNYFPNLESLNLRDLHFVGYGDYEHSIMRQIDNDNSTVVYLGQINSGIIPWRAFYGMTKLQYVEFPSDLKVLGDEAFKNTGLRCSCILPEGLEYIGLQAFAEDVRWNVLPNVTPHMTGELYIPSTCKVIGDFAFYGQDFSNELVLPEQMLYLGEQAFGNCKFMTGYIHIPKGLKTVRNSWNGMKRLKGWAEIPSDVKYINGIGCPISSLHVPEGVIELNGLWYIDLAGARQLEPERKELKEVFLPSTIKTLGEYAFASTSISHIKLPESLERIRTCCFYKCQNLKDTLTLPKDLKIIDHGAFEECRQLKAVIIPSNLQEIGYSVFRGCYSLEYIQCLGSIPPSLKDDVFYGVNKDNITLVVPEDAIETYRNASGWSEFKRISAYQNFVCRPMRDKLLNKGHEMTVVLNADEGWTMTHCPSWARVSQTSGTKKTELKVTINDLVHGVGSRSDSIVFMLNGKLDEEGHAITCSYQLEQYDYGYEEDSELALQQATRGNGKVNIFICGDGYDAKDIANGTYLADMRQEMEYFFDVEPYRTYKDYFNVYTGFALSRESGINTTNQWRETKFETILGNSCQDGTRLHGRDDIAMTYALEVSPQIAPDGTAAPLVIMLANTDLYEGVTYMWPDNSAVAWCTKSTAPYPNDARGIIQHEAGGHGFGKLADEYIYHQAYIERCGCLCCEHVPELMVMKGLGWARNLSLEGKYGSNEWRQLIFDPHYDDICDIYEGGFFHARGVYRSEVNSCMNNGVPYFSTVSRMAIVERIKRYAGEEFSYEEFVANDKRNMGSKFLTRGTSPDLSGGAGHGMHLSAPVIRKGSVLNLLKNKKR